MVDVGGQPLRNLTLFVGDRVRGIVLVAIFLPVTPAQSLLPPAVHAVVTLVQTITALLLVALTFRLRERDSSDIPR